jgi:hypothetical protein
MGFTILIYILSNYEFNKAINNDTCLIKFLLHLFDSKMHNMDFGGLIADLLLRNQQVCIPKIGKLSFIYKPAEISKYLQKINPPSKILQFIHDVSCDDKQLITALTSFYQINKIEAQKEVDAFVKNIQTKLEAEGKIFIDEIGTFKLVDNTIHFETVKEGILYSDSYGLDIVNLPLIDIEEPKKAGPQTFPPPTFQHTIVSRRKANWVIYSAISLAAVGILAALYFILEFDNPYKDLVKKINISTALNKPHVSSKDSIEKTLNARNKIRDALLYKETKPNKPDTLKKVDKYIHCTKFYLVTGSFRSYNYAIKLKMELDRSGYQSEILNCNNSIFRVTLKTFTDRNLAIEELNKFRSDTSVKYNVWLFSL